MEKLDKSEWDFSLSKVNDLLSPNVKLAIQFNKLCVRSFTQTTMLCINACMMYAGNRPATVRAHSPGRGGQRSLWAACGQTAPAASRLFQAGTRARLRRSATDDARCWRRCSDTPGAATPRSPRETVSPDGTRKMTKTHRFGALWETPDGNIKKTNDCSFGAFC